MKTEFYIQDVETKRYFKRFRDTEYFVADYKDATRYRSKDDALEDLSEFCGVLEDKVLTIVEYYFL